MLFKNMCPQKQCIAVLQYTVLSEVSGVFGSAPVGAISSVNSITPELSFLLLKATLHYQSRNSLLMSLGKSWEGAGKMSWKGCEVSLSL